jgi:NADP-dependent 3-hydroxy acid dehydrogenase YdfG
MTDNGKTKPLSKSQKFLNYCKGVGALVAALSGIAAIIISVMTSISAKEEPVAKAGYKASEAIVKKLSEDIRREHDERVLAEKLIANDMKNLRSELQLVVKLLSMQRYRRRRPRSASNGSAVATVVASASCSASSLFW